MKDNKVIFWSTWSGLEDIVPPQPAKNYIPEWWKNTPAFKPDAPEHSLPRDRGTIKICPSIQDWFSQGYVLPMWCDLHIELKENGDVKVLGSPSMWEGRQPQQLFMNPQAYVSWLPEQQKEQVVAIFRPPCPWRIKTPAGYSCYQFPMYYHFNPDFEVPPGPVWSDEYHTIAPQIVLKHYGETKLKRGTPLCVFVPYKREPDDTFHYEIKKQDKELQTLDQKSNLITQTKLIGGYKEMQKDKGGCPMHKEPE